MRCWILAFSLGVYLGGFIPHLPEFRHCLLFLLPLLLSYRFRGLFLAAAFSTGLAWLLCWASFYKQQIITPDLQQQDIWVQGSIAGLPVKENANTRFIFKVSFLCNIAQPENCASMQGNSGSSKLFAGNTLFKASEFRLLLNDFYGQDYLPGQQWLLKVRLKRPHGFANPGVFDYERWLFQEKISATGYVRQDSQNRLLSAQSSLFGLSVINHLRYQVQVKLTELPLLAPGYLSALMIGDRYLISEEQWSLLTHTGSNHLMVISGLHIGLVAWLVFGFSLASSRCWPALCLLIPAPRAAAILALMAAIFYACLAGFTLPVQRALVMVSCLMSGQLLVRQVSPVNNLCLALFFVVLLDPLSVQTAGFWLSFFAVSVLLLAALNPDENNEGSLLQKTMLLLRCQAYLFAGMMPFMLLFFSQVSLIAPLINIVAIPFIGLIVVPLCLFSLLLLLAGAPGEGYFVKLITVPDFLLTLYTDVLTWIVSSSELLLVQFPRLPQWLLGLMLGIMFLQFINKRFYTRLAGIVIISLGLFYRSARPEAGEFRIDILDVGQGLSVVISTSKHLLVYDTGPAFSQRFNAGSGIIQPFIHHRNLGIPDLIVVSHGDNDHAGGLQALHSIFPDSRIVAGDKPFAMHVKALPCVAGQHWTWDEIDFEFLYPSNSNLEGNNASCVLRISTGKYGVLLPGDIEQAAELTLLRESGKTLQADILVTPHHGSLTSSIGPFIRRVNPQYVVHSVGYLNRFNHPHPRIRARYERYETRQLETALTGTVSFHLSVLKGIQKPELYRQMQPRFWRERPLEM